MKTTATCPEQPDDPEKENGPSLSANIETDHLSDKAQTNISGKNADSQSGDTLDDSPSVDVPEGKQFREQQPVDISEDSPSSGILTPESILQMRLPASELDAAEVKVVRSRFTIGKPPKDQFFRVHPGEDYWLPFGLLEVERTSAFYLVPPGSVRNWMIEDDIKSFFDCVMCLTVTRHGEPRIWPLKQTENLWHESARDIAEMAKKEWVKLISDQGAGYYVAGTPTNQSKEPVWPEESFAEILVKTFSGRIIDSLDHEVIKELRGDD